MNLNIKYVFNFKALDNVLLENKITIDERNYDVQQYNENENVPKVCTSKVLETNNQVEKHVIRDHGKGNSCLLDKNISDPLNTGILIENVNENEVEFILLLYKNERKTSGGAIKEHKYDRTNKKLIIHYESLIVAEKVLKKGITDHNNKIYKAKKFDNITEGEGLAEKSKLIEYLYVFINSITLFF
jgi:hypothetical protein